MGYYSRINSGVKTEGVVPRHAGDLHQGDHTGQAGAEEPVRVSRLHHSGARSHTHLDFQSQVKRETSQVGSSWSGTSITDLIVINLKIHII